MTEPTVSDYPTQAEIDEIHDPFGLRNAVAPQLPPLTEPTRDDLANANEIALHIIQQAGRLAAAEAENERLRAALAFAGEEHKAVLTINQRLRAALDEAVRLLREVLDVATDFAMSDGEAIRRIEILLARLPYEGDKIEGAGLASQGTSAAAANATGVTSGPGPSGGGDLQGGDG